MQTARLFFRLIAGCASVGAVCAFAPAVLAALNDDIPDGVAEMRAPDGTLSSRMVYKDGMLDGPFEKFNPDGTLAEIRTYRKDKLNGPARRYYPNGRVAEEIGYVDGLLNGPHLRVDPNGKRIVEAVYERGKPADTHRVYGTDEALISEIRYIDGEKTKIPKKSSAVDFKKRS